MPCYWYLCVLLWFPDYQFCTELDGQEQPYYPTNGKTDMFWDQVRS